MSTAAMIVWIVSLALVWMAFGSAGKWQWGAWDHALRPSRARRVMQDQLSRRARRNAVARSFQCGVVDAAALGHTSVFWRILHG